MREESKLPGLFEEAKDHLEIEEMEEREGEEGGVGSSSSFSNSSFSRDDRNNERDEEDDDISFEAAKIVSNTGVAIATTSFHGAIQAMGAVREARGGKGKGKGNGKKTKLDGAQLDGALDSKPLRGVPLWLQ